MFYLIQFNDINDEETKQLKFNLSGYPNGTILSHSQHIKVTIMPTDKWIVWMDKNNIYEFDKQYEDFSKINGIKSIIELDIKKSPYDNDWIWDDNYINNIFRYYA